MSYWYIRVTSYQKGKDDKKFGKGVSLLRRGRGGCLLLRELREGERARPAIAAGALSVEDDTPPFVQIVCIGVHGINNRYRHQVHIWNR